MNDNRRWIRIGLATVLALVIGGGGFAFIRSWLTGPDNIVQRGERSYSRGMESLDTGDASGAVRQLDEAVLLASKALDELEKRRQTAQAPDVGSITALEGQAYWLKARAIRDRAYAQGVADSKPLVTALDTASGKHFRTLLAVPDDKARQEGIGCLRQAAMRLTGNAEIQEEALKVEVVLVPMQWSLVEKFSRNAIAADPKDTRARYLLARFEFEQPPTDGKGSATPLDKRKRDRVVKAEEHLARLKEADGYPLWRTLHLQAQVHTWLRDDAANRGKVEERDRQDEALRGILKRADAEARKLPENKEQLARLSSWDLQGMFALQLMLMDAAAAEVRKADADPTPILDALSNLLALCQKVTAGDAPPARLEEAAVTALAAVSRTETLVGTDPPPQWAAHLVSVQALARKAREAKVASPALYTGVAALLAREAALEGRRKNLNRQKELRKEADQWIEDGLRAGSEGKVPAAELLGLHGLAAEMKLLRGEKREAIAPHLEALKKGKTPEMKANVALLDGALAEREGRLEAARRNLEEAMAGSAALALRANLVLANVYLALNQPDRALASLALVEKAYQRFEDLPERDRNWAMAFTRAPDDIVVLLVQAHLESARNRAARLVEQKADTRAVLETMRGSEEAVQRLLPKLTAKTPQQETARRLLAIHCAATGRADQAKEVLAELRKDFPDSLDVLRTEIQVLLLTPLGKRVAADAAPAPEVIKKGDQRIREFMNKNPKDSAARLFWAEWLLRSKRAAEAVDYLQDPANFPDGRDDRHKRVLGVALLVKGDRAAGVEVLRHLPHDSTIDALLIQAGAGSGTEKEKQVGEALARYESNGLFRCWEAATAFEKGKYAEAAASYLRALEFTRVKGLAREGLTRSLFALVETRPEKAILKTGPEEANALILKMLETQPEEPALLLACAFARLRLDEIGQPTDNWENAKTMSAALNQWERMMLKEGQNPVVGPLTKAAFWAVANRPDRARLEINRARKLDPKNADAARIGLQVDLEAQDSELLGEARQHLAVLKEVALDDPLTAILEARLLEREGKTGDAVKVLEKLLEKHPRESGGYAELLVLLERQGEKDKARGWAERWRKELPEDLSAAQAEVRQLAAAGKAGAAVAAGELFRDQAIEREEKKLSSAKAPEGTDPREWERTQHAKIEALRETIEVAMCRALVAGEAGNEAEKWVRRLLEKKPDLAVAELLLGDIYMARKDWKRARELFTAMGRHRNSPDAVNNSAWILAAGNLAWIFAVQSDDPAAAYAIVQEVRKGRSSGKPISGDRLNADFLDTVGIIYEKLNKTELYPEMRELFEAARLRYPNDPRVYLYLGIAYAGLQETAKAEEMLTAAVTLSGPQSKSNLKPEERAEVLERARRAQMKLKATSP
jgi:tetratricopeptide (TPR) repeat protein